MTVLPRRPVPRPGFDLAQHGDTPALVVGHEEISYLRLQELVDARAATLGRTRRLVLLECANELEPLVTYLACLAGGRPVMLVPARTGSAAHDQWDRLVAAYDPDVLCRRDHPDGVEEVRTGTRHELHPDLAVLLGTSGSTGTPKLVRLSHDNLLSNAQAIAGYLHLGPGSRAATTLQMQYCYGLSVVNSHLLAGGSLWLTDRSVVDPEFWEGFDRVGATSFAGVPYTFDLLDRAGTDWLARPTLRQVTQAGGALPAERVRALARAATDAGVELFVMYGATEATARMAYLPPHLAVARAGTIGVPIEGGDLRIDDGELVYTGPNVMLGYAETPADLARGRTVHELRTGDLGVQDDDGLYRVTGRRNRLAKLFGTRLDLDVTERLLAANGIEARAVATERLVVFMTDAHRTRTARELVRRHHCLPAHSVTVRVLTDLPRTANGKPDHATLERLATEAEHPPPATSARDVLALVLQRPVQPHDTFAGLGGDSLSYVEASVRLEQVLGTLPRDWPHRTVAELDASTRRARRHTAFLETPVLLRALAIVLVVGSHTELFDLMGGAHVLLGLVGFNLARFALARRTRGQRVRALGAAVREVAVPSAVWIGAVAVLTGKYDWHTALLANEWLGSDTWDDRWQYWFLAVAVAGTAGLALLVAVPWVDRVERRRPFGFAVAVLVALLALRTALAGGRAEHLEVYLLGTSAWLLALGWVVAAARDVRRRLVATALVIGATVGWFGDTSRELVVITGLLAALWLPGLTVPRVVVRPVSWVAGASLFIYLTHWVVYPPLDADHDFWAAALSVLVGVVAWQAYAPLRRVLVDGTRRIVGPERSRDAQPQERRTGSDSRPKTMDFSCTSRSAGSTASRISGNRRASAG